MQRLFLILVFLLSARTAHAQRLVPADYVYPISGVQRLHAANFGEMRPNHFHSGVDIKTEGVEGKPVVAVADGFVSRVTVSPGGFGRAVYITLRTGFTAVYGHLARFSDPIEQYVRNKRMRQQKNRVDLSIPPGRFPVSQGDVVAYSGNSGTSFGPHLHFELRQTLTQRTLNIVKLGVLPVRDDISPYILRILYIETDTVRGVPVHRAPVSYETAKVNDSTFRLTRRDPIPVGTNGYFAVEVTDRRNGVANTFGIYRATLRLDGQPHFEYRMDGFTFNQSRDCNAAAYYPIQLASRNEVIRLGAIDGANRDFCPISHERGVVSAAPGEMHPLCIEIEDDNGNTSRMEFKIKGRTPWQATDDPALEVCDRRRTSIFTAENVRLTIPAGALYESILLHIGRSNAKPASNTPLTVLSPAYRLLDRTVPLKKPVEVSISADIPERLRPYTMLGALTPDGRIHYVGGRYENGAVTARTSTTGPMLIVADTLPPIVKPHFTSGQEMTNASGITFHTSDNFSGITACELRIDGTWVVCDRYPVKNTVVHLFDKPKSGSVHDVHLTVRDAYGNTTEWSGSFFR